MVKSEIHSRRRKHKYGHFGGKLEPTSPGSMNPGNTSLPYSASSNQSSPPGMLSQTLPLGFPESPSLASGKECCETDQRVGSTSSSPEPGQEMEKSSLTDRENLATNCQDQPTRCEQLCELEAEDSGEEVPCDNSPITEMPAIHDRESSDMMHPCPPLLSSE